MAASQENAALSRNSNGVPAANTSTKTYDQFFNQWVPQQGQQLTGVFAQDPPRPHSALQGQPPAKTPYFPIYPTNTVTQAQNKQFTSSSTEPFTFATIQKQYANSHPHVAAASSTASPASQYTQQAQSLAPRPASAAHSSAAPSLQGSLKQSVHSILGSKSSYNSSSAHPTNTQYPTTKAQQSTWNQTPAVPIRTVTPQVLAAPGKPPSSYDALPVGPAAQPSAIYPGFFVIDPAAHCAATKSRFAGTNICLSTEPIELPYSRAGVLPKYEKRLSLNQLRPYAKTDTELRGKIEKADKKHRSKNHQRGIKTKPSAASAASGVASPSPSVYSDSSSAEDDSDYSDSDLEIEEPFPLPSVRPTDPLKAAEYDAVKAVWHSRSSYVQNDTLLSRITQFSEFFFKLRDRWKASSEALKEATDKKQSEQLSGLKSQVKRYRSILEVAINAAVQYGHPHILDILGENKRLLSALYNILVAQLKEDSNGPLSIAVLKLMDQFKQLSSDTLQATKFTKLLAIMTKRGTEEVKALVKNITDRATANTDKSGDGKKPDATPKVAANGVAAKVSAVPAKPVVKPITSKPSEAVLTVRKAASVVSSTDTTLKRPRPADAAASAQAVKRQAVISSLGSKPAATAATAKRPVSTVGSKSSAFSGAAKPSPANTIKRPAPAASAAKPSFSFGGMMAGLLSDKSKEEKVVKKEEAPKESTEEKAKRERKEARRKLRVTWKPDSELVAIKLFTHDPEEETGHDASSVRDVADVGNEGRMFKQLHKDHKEIVDMDMDEEEQTFGENDWITPTLVDFSELDQAELAKNFVRFGGEQVPDSEDKLKQEQYEAANLLVVYISKADIPPRPSSPVGVDDGPRIETVNFGEPDDRTRRRSAAYAPKPVEPTPTPAPAPAPASTPAAVSAAPADTLDWAAISSILGGNSQPVQQQPAPVVPAPAPLPQPDLLQGVSPDLLAALLGGPPPQQPSQPEQAPPAPAPAPSFDPTALPPLDPSLLASLFSVAAAPQAQSNGVPDVAGLLAQLGSFGQTTQQQPQAPAMPDLSALLATLGGSIPDQQQAAFPGFPGFQAPQQPDIAPYENPERKRQREIEDDGYDSGSYNSNKRNNTGGFGNNNNTAGRNTADVNGFKARKKWGNNNDNGGQGKKFSLPCRFWPMGKCLKGADCTYRHDPL